MQLTYNEYIKLCISAGLHTIKDIRLKSEMFDLPKGPEHFFNVTIEQIVEDIKKKWMNYLSSKYILIVADLYYQVETGFPCHLKDGKITKAFTLTPKTKNIKVKLNGKSKTWKLLVWEHFKGKTDQRLHHRDKDTLNCLIENLY